MKCIVGLGNPGRKYENNRHNVGAMFVDYIAQLLNGSIVSNRTIEQSNNKSIFNSDKYLQADILKTNNVLLIKPQTFMNNSGISVASCVTRYTLNVTQDLIVVHDDLDIPLGKFKIQQGTGPKVHNGLTSIEEHIRTDEFWRIRIGVENRSGEYRIPGETYVLQDFLPDEEVIIHDTFHQIFLRLQQNLLK